MRNASCAVTALMAITAWTAGAGAQELDDPRPIAAADVVWIDEMTWMEVRDALAAGKTTAIIATGGIEQNGPYLTTGKHNVQLRGNCEAIARRLGDALCAPVIKFVPEGDIERKTGHMRYPGTISLREETYRMLVDDVASSLRAHGFTDVVLIGDSGGNQAGLAAVAETLNERWAGSGSRAHFFREFYDAKGDALHRYMEDVLGFVETTDDGIHDNARATALMMAVDPTTVRYDQRVAAGLTTINGVSITPRETMIELGRKLQDFNADYMSRLIRDARSQAAAGRR